ncbi:hypothetical protein MSSIT_3593 [Methanosarcina siciliae T4/M]|uniref:Uncharacterized protein n=1 Tax=Methanosarcina siciliae T4/M TaxID=1434120 RepID=A0A0E3P8N4_9EURY|nr:hypothetical protein MSSIT_3593 [Methanosarcina siciliae T4/M]
MSFTGSSGITISVDDVEFSGFGITRTEDLRCGMIRQFFGLRIFGHLKEAERGWILLFLHFILTDFLDPRVSRF